MDFSSFLNIVDGKTVPTRTFRNGINPANREKLWPAPVSTLEDVHAAVDSAGCAASGWAATSWLDRQRCVSKLADALAGHAQQFAQLLTLEQGKPLPIAEGEVSDAVRMLQGAAKLQLTDTVIEETQEHRILTRHIPIGVCVGIVPWNFPLTLATFKLGSALVAGNPIIIKPSPFTPYSALKLVELAQRFFPPGVVQALSGDDELGPWLTEHLGVDKVSFTGSTATGMRVLQSCAKTLKRVTLELGGNDPAIVCPDVDINTVASKIGTLALYNSGQVCIAIKRVYVHSSIYDAFVKEMTKFVQSLTVGDGRDKASDLGPVQNEMQYSKLQSLVARIKEDGLHVLTQDLEKTFANDKGFYMSPIIVGDPPDDSEIATEEPFGPIFPVTKWDTEEEVINRANDSQNGLGASVWSRNPIQANRIASQLQAGNVWINTHMQLRPDAAFSGLKHSGIGSELGLEGLKSYCNVQTIYQQIVKNA